MRDSEGYQRDIYRLLDKEVYLNQTLLDANVGLRQMLYGKVLNSSWKDSSNFIKAVTSFHYEHLLSALQFSPQRSDSF